MPGSQEKPSGWLVVCPSIRSTTLFAAIVNPLRGLLARAQRSYAGKFWRIEVRSGKHKASEERRGAGERMCVNPVLLAERAALAEYITPGHTTAFHTFLGLWAKIKCSICSYQFNI